MDVALKTEAGLNSVVLGVEVIVTDAGRCCSLCNLLYYLFSPLLSYSLERSALVLDTIVVGVQLNEVHVHCNPPN
jgi:hypothetical protein